eukprot:gene16761-biopygen335
MSVCGQNRPGSPQFFYFRHERPIRWFFLDFLLGGKVAAWRHLWHWRQSLAAWRHSEWRQNCAKMAGKLRQSWRQKLVASRHDGKVTAQLGHGGMAAKWRQSWRHGGMAARWLQREPCLWGMHAAVSREGHGTPPLMPASVGHARDSGRPRARSATSKLAAALSSPRQTEPPVLGLQLIHAGTLLLLHRLQCLPGCAAERARHPLPQSAQHSHKFSCAALTRTVISADCTACG